MPDNFDNEVDVNFYHFVNVATGKVATLDDDGYIRQYPHNPNDFRQQWTISAEGFDSSTPFSAGSRVAAAVIDGQGGLADGAKLQKYPFHGDGNQIFRAFRVNPDSDDQFYIRAGESDWSDHDLQGRFVWDLPGGDTAEGVQLQLLKFNGGENQKWKIVFSDGYGLVHNIVKASDDNQALEVASYNAPNGTPVKIAPFDGNLNQMWTFLHMAEGRYKIMSISCGKVLDYPLEAAKNELESGLSVYDDNGGDNQIWRLFRAGKTWPTGPYLHPDGSDNRFNIRCGLEPNDC